MTKPVLHIISHTDLDGVTAAALAWHANKDTGRMLRVTLCGYGEVDNLILETLESGQEPLVLDLFCQRDNTVDAIDKIWQADAPPFLFDHHKSNFERYASRKWALIDVNYCGAMVYWNYLMAQDLEPERRARVQAMEPLIRIANDRDLWLGKIADSRLSQGLVTVCGHWGTMMRLAENPSHVLTQAERLAAESFVADQEARFAVARSRIIRTGDELSFVCDGVLEYGDVSDFCGLILDRDDNPPQVAAVAAKRMGGDWAVSLRSRDGLAGRVMSLLKDGRKVRGGGHGDASALYFPSNYTEMQIKDSLLAAIRVQIEKEASPKVTLGDLFKGLA